MYTAIVLVCLTGIIHSSDRCFTYTNKRIFDTIQQCESAVVLGIQNKIFEMEIDGNQKFGVIDWYCVDWNGKRV